MPPPHIDPGNDAHQLVWLFVAPPASSLLMLTVTGEDSAVAAIVAANLGAIAADEARNVILIDTDARSCPVASALRVNAEPGIHDILDGRLRWPETTQHATIGRDRVVDVVASGTATLETALLGTPEVIVYRISRATWFLGKFLLKVRMFGIVNIILGEEVVPELVQHDFTAENVVARVKEIIPEDAARARMLAGLTKVKEKLRGTSEASGQRAADRAAELILRLAEERGIPLQRTAQGAVPARG